MKQVYKAWGTFKIEDYERQVFSVLFLLIGKEGMQLGRHALTSLAQRHWGWWHPL